MVFSNFAGGDDFLSGAPQYFSDNREERQNQTGSRFTVSIDNCQILRTEIRHSSQC
ncbi:hypothetical protein AB82_5224 [Escherichia coli 2-005-03_S3_C1]|nr:hypothetical protein AB82_5224 [Escherichia coli 2-005-03_S3_C1]KDW62994.1 hypothetical protein AC40_5249 [Escherichia coli 2-005-03_S3_C3]CCE57649.2 hypothetical protein HUS2011_pII0032 [Escherichia coli]